MVGPERRGEREEEKEREKRERVTGREREREREKREERERDRKRERERERDRCFHLRLNPPTRITMFTVEQVTVDTDTVYQVTEEHVVKQIVVGHRQHRAAHASVVTTKSSTVTPVTFR